MNTKKVKLVRNYVSHNTKSNSETKISRQTKPFQDKISPVIMFSYFILHERFQNKQST